jgi:hypothetical protein
MSPQTDASQRVVVGVVGEDIQQVYAIAYVATTKHELAKYALVWYLDRA